MDFRILSIKYIFNKRLIQSKMNKNQKINQSDKLLFELFKRYESESLINLRIKNDVEEYLLNYKYKSLK